MIEHVPLQALLLASPQYGYTSKALPHGSVRMLRTTDITRSEGVDWGSVPFCDLADDQSSKYRLSTDDLLVSRAGTVGVSHLLRQDPPASTVFASYLIRLRVDRGRVLPSYLHWFMQSPAYWQQITTMSAGVAQPNINATKLRELSIPLRSTAEQHAIVETIERMLSRLDAGRDNILTARRRLELLQAAVDSHATYGQLHDVKGDRNDALASVAACRGNRDPKGILSAAVPDGLTVPETWVWSSIDELADVQAGAAKSKKLERADGCVERPYLSVANVQRGKLALDEVKTMWVRTSKLDDLTLRPGDVLFNEGGDKDKLGRGWIWEGQVKDCVHQNHVFRARLRDQEVDPRWLSHWGNVFGRWWFHARGSQTTGIASINKAVLRSLPVPVPPLVEQQAILDELDRRGTEIEHAVRTIETATLRAAALRRSILKAAFEGRLTSTAAAPSADDLQEKIA